MGETDSLADSTTDVGQLVLRARLHDAEAFAELIRRYEGIALSIAYAHTRNRSDAGDIVQEAFLRAWSRLDSLDEPNRFGSWLGRMVRNLAIDLRRRKRPALLDLSIDRPRVDTTEAPDVPLELQEQKGQIDRALGALDDLSRTCVVLRYYENQSSKEIADLLEISPAAVDMRLSRARGQLKERLLGVVQPDPRD